ncbi:MAG: hypothetical protein KH077_09390, partial [Collinsella sp.]|nr:hypothetical protein [Collinsella sp.]
MISPFELLSALAQRVDRFILAGFIWANVCRHEGAAFHRGGLLAEKPSEQAFCRRPSTPQNATALTCTDNCPWGKRALRGRVNGARFPRRSATLMLN